MVLEFIRLEDAGSVQQHAPRMAQWIFESGPKFFAALFGSSERAIENLSAWLQRDTSEFSGLQATLAFDGSEPAGMFIGVPGQEIARRRRADLLGLIQQTPADERELLKAKFQSMAELTAPVTENDYYIRTLAVDRAHRGRGFGRRLLERAIADAQALGCRAVCLDVDADNDVARGLYGSAGFTSIYEGKAASLGLHMHSLALTF